MSQKQKIGLGIAIIVLVFGAAIAWITSHSKPNTDKNGPPVCILSGDMKNSRNKSTGFGNLGNFIRLHFDATNIDECKTASSSYCHSKINEGYSPGKLIMTYRQDPRANESTRLRVTGHCIFEQYEGED